MRLSELILIYKIIKKYFRKIKKIKNKNEKYKKRSQHTHLPTL
jgi:hypothetical protein